MSDLIERQKALDALKGKLNASVKDTEAVVEYLNGVIERILQLPSADPETHEERTETHACVSPCDACRYYPPSSSDGKPCCMCPAEGSLDDK